MKLRNKKTGEIKEWQRVGAIDYGELNEVYDSVEYNSLAELNDEWEDYEPVEPIFDEKIRRGIRAWWDMQDNPFKSACVMLIGKNKDLDGFYHWTIFGYIRNGAEKMSTKLEFRTKKLYSYKPHHDYTKEELCGEE